jgi:cytochrome P450
MKNIPVSLSIRETRQERKHPTPLQIIRARRVQLAKKTKLSRWWLGSWFVFIHDAELSTILHSEREIFEKYISQEQKPRWNLPGQFFGTNIVFSNGKEWRRFRKIINPAFHFNVVANFTNIFNTLSDRLIGEWNKINDQPIVVK